MKSSIDTNVLVYAHDRGDGAKHDRAVAVLADLSQSELFISTQVLNEFYVVTTRPGKELLSRAHAREIVMALSWTTVEPVDADLVRRAMELHPVHALSYWDSLVVAAAARAGCACILTEDLDDGAVVNVCGSRTPFDLVPSNQVPQRNEPGWAAAGARARDAVGAYVKYWHAVDALLASRSPADLRQSVSPG